MEQNSEALIPSPLQASEEELSIDRRSMQWDYNALFKALAISVLLQTMFLSFLCFEGKIMTDFAMLFDAFVLMRILIAWLRKERGRTWLFYAILLYTSPIWILTVFVILFKYF